MHLYNYVVHLMCLIHFLIIFTRFKSRMNCKDYQEAVEVTQVDMPYKRSLTIKLKRKQ